MLINDDFGYIGQALSRCECLLSNNETLHPDDPQVVVGNNRELLRLVRIALSVHRQPYVSVDELRPFLGERWVVVKQRRKDRDTSRYNGCDGTERQILLRELRAAEQAAIEARHP